MANDRHLQFVAKYFAYGHLPHHLQPISHQFHDVAHFMMNNCLGDDAELMAGLRKLVEAKDCAVRAAL